MMRRKPANEATFDQALSITPTLTSQIDGDYDFAFTASGELLVAWQQRDQSDSYWNLWVRRYSPDGGWSDPALAEGLNRNVSGIQVASNSADEIWVSFMAGQPYTLTF